jgi:hypothetical protein
MGIYMAELKITVTKSELKDLLGCTTWKRFYAKFMTDHVQRNILNLTKEEYKAIREFDVEQTRLIYQYFELERH